MKEISRSKKVEVVTCYVLGQSYNDIVSLIGISKGSVTKIIGEAIEGKLSMPGAPSDQLKDLHQLSLDLKDKGLDPSQALLGLSLFEKFQKLEVTPQMVQEWAGLVKQFGDGLPPGKFLNSALKLRHLEESSGKSYEEVVDHYQELEQESEQINHEVKTLEQQRGSLSHELERLSTENKRTISDHNALQEKVKSLQSEVKGLEKLRQEVKELKAAKANLASDIQTKKEELERLEKLGFDESQLMKLRVLLEQIQQREEIEGDELTESFFAALTKFGSLKKLEEEIQFKVDKLTTTRNEAATLQGMIKNLNMQKAAIEGEIQQATLEGVDMVRKAAMNISLELQEAGTNVAQELDSIRTGVNLLSSDLLNTGRAVGQMEEKVSSAKQSQDSLNAFLGKMKGKIN